MKLSPELIKNHQALSGCNVRFLEYAGSHPEILERSTFHKIYEDERFKYLFLQAWPTFINRACKARFKEAALKVLNLIKCIPGRLFAYDSVRMSRSYGIPEHQCRRMLWGVDNDYLDRLFARGDFIITPSQQLKCIEFNIQATLGGWQRDFIKLHYLGTPVISRFLDEQRVQLEKNGFFDFLMEHVADGILWWLERQKDMPGEINIAMVIPGKDEGGLSYMSDLMKRLYDEILWKINLTREKNRSLAGDIIFCSFEQLEGRDGCIHYTGKYTDKPKRIHTIIELLNGNNIPDWIMEAVKLGNLLLYNGPVTGLMSNKLNLAFLSQHEHSDLFSAEEREAIGNHIPWTRQIVPGETTYGSKRIRLEDFIFSHREHLVIKFSRSLGGRDVFAGPNCTPAQWREVVIRAFQGVDWVVQELVPSASYLYQHGEQGWTEHTAAWGFFIFGQRYGGGFVRVIPKEKNQVVINVAQGAESGMILEVAE